MGKIITVTSGQQDENEYLHDKGGSERWRRECLEMEEAGVYDELSAIIGEKRYELLLDICCGFCPLEKRLAKQNPSAHFVGVDINSETLQTAKSDLFRANISSHVYRSRAGHNIIADRDVLSEGNMYTKAWEDMRGQVLLIEADVAKAADTILEATNGELADMSIHTFMGMSHKLHFREPLESMQLHASAIQNPFALATRLTKTNGTLLMAQRSVQPRNQSSERTLEKVTELNKTLIGSFWKFVKKPRMLRTEIADIRTAGTPKFSDRVLKEAYVTEVVRTKKEMDPAEFAVIRNKIIAIIERDSVELSQE